MSKVEMDFASAEEDDASLITFVNNKTGIKRAKNRSSNLKTPRQKYCEAWELSFPWLKGDKVDECLGICTICNKQLVCKKSHLERHQASFKHQRAMGFEVCVTKQEEDDDEPGEVKEDNEFEEFEIEHIDIGNESGNTSSQQMSEEIVKFDIESSQKKKIQNTTVAQVPKKRRTEKLVERNVQKNNEQQANLMRLKLLKRIDKDRNELNEYYYARQKTPLVASPPKDNFDLFFDSVSASVKALPLKLGYEFKSKVSQLLTEFELRALCEKEAEEKAANYPHSSTPVIVTSGLDGIVKANSPQVMYSFQSK